MISAESLRSLTDSARQAGEAGSKGDQIINTGTPPDSGPQVASNLASAPAKESPAETQRVASHNQYAELSPPKPRAEASPAVQGQGNTQADTRPKGIVSSLASLSKGTLASLSGKAPQMGEAKTMGRGNHFASMGSSMGMSAESRPKDRPIARLGQSMAGRKFPSMPTQTHTRSMPSLAQTKSGGMEIG